jgi:hypothetical protein
MSVIGFRTWHQLLLLLFRERTVRASWSAGYFVQGGAMPGIRVQNGPLGEHLMAEVSLNGSSLNKPAIDVNFLGAQ